MTATMQFASQYAVNPNPTEYLKLLFALLQEEIGQEQTGDVLKILF